LWGEGMKVKAFGSYNFPYALGEDKRVMASLAGARMILGAAGYWDDLGDLVVLRPGIVEVKLAFYDDDSWTDIDTAIDTAKKTLFLERESLKLAPGDGSGSATREALARCVSFDEVWRYDTPRLVVCIGKVRVVTATLGFNQSIVGLLHGRVIFRRQLGVDLQNRANVDDQIERSGEHVVHVGEPDAGRMVDQVRRCQQTYCGRQVRQLLLWVVDSGTLLGLRKRVAVCDVGQQFRRVPHRVHGTGSASKSIHSVANVSAAVLLVRVLCVGVTMTVAYDSGFLRIDIEDASGNRQGYGPLVTMLSLTRTRELDRIGGISFPVPATDPRTQHLQVGYHYKAYHKVLGYLGEFVHQKATVQPGEHPTMVVQADDLLRELTAANCLFNREYSNNYLGTIVSDLLTLASGWGDGDIDNVGYTSLDFQGESVLNAIVLLAQAGGAHFRMGDSDRTLDFGTFGEDSGLRCMSVSVLGPELEDNDDLAIISSIEIAEEGGGIVNRLIPLGAGNGKSQLTLEHATVTDPSYPVQTGTNPDGSSYYYIEDTDSQTTYGLVVAPWARSDIRPLTNSDVDLANAANALYQVSLAALLRMKQPVTVYRLEIQKLRVDLRPGQTVQAIHQGTVMYDGTPYKWVDLDADMIVLAIRDQFSADGKNLAQPGCVGVWIPAGV